MSSKKVRTNDETKMKIIEKTVSEISDIFGHLDSLTNISIYFMADHWDFDNYSC